MIYQIALLALIAAIAASVAVGHGSFSAGSNRSGSSKAAAAPPEPPVDPPVDPPDPPDPTPPPTGELYNFPTQNIFDSYDPLCDSTDASIIFCDGFEDGKWIDMSINECSSPQTCACWSPYYGHATSDYWAMSGSSIGPYTCSHARTGVIWDFAHCNTGTIDENLADFGASGTPCTGSMNWNQGRNDWGVHAMHSGHALYCSGGDCSRVDTSKGTSHMSIRFYFKESGVTSKMCDCNEGAGLDCNRTTLPSPLCPAFATRGSNGYKQIELGKNQTGGIQGNLSGTNSSTNGRFGYGTSSCSAWGRSGGGCRAGGQHGGPAFDHRQHRDEWIFMEMEQKHATGPGRTDGHVRIWMDACGRDGKGCTGTPTLRAECTGLNNWNDGGGCFNDFNMLWHNWWSGDGSVGNFKGEIQADEIVIRDRGITDADIGFAPVF